MRSFGKLLLTGITAGAILAVSLKIVQLITGNTASILLYNMDYIPLLKKWDSVTGAGLLFHFVTCIVSVVVLYYFLKLFSLEQKVRLYVVIYTIGGAILFFLSALSETPPAYSDMAAWIYWTAGHAVFGIFVGLFIKKWL
ncbi:hypothetical protein CIL05_13565 [Virgibacillus profundi]|uniref:DUF1440 domain-containing protein n=1 Tax=Virgibacillus profundi TaxID=2024555 RepID=A0A2A2IC26_9BACI|nr:hypothetical protein [Virgibacillus profundi]PAV29122.1 hypothetical protein CIL05_13565 [Virgibacillus profundi]PXY53172.1 hypothetical protein CIT14_13690 [Virgibacillus profundi]